MSDTEVHDLPYRAEYAKSSRASCRGCKGNIEKETLRMAVLVQSPKFDSKMAMWYHFMCFFGKQRPSAVGDIGNFENLRMSDQDKIRKKIEECAGMPAANGKTKGAAKRTNAGVKKGEKLNYRIEYAVSSRATCRGCHEKIVKGEVRASKKDFESDEGKRYGGLDLWHHLPCFVKLRSDLGYFQSGKLLSGFDSLSKEDKESVSKALPEIKGEPVKDEVDSGIPAKKVKTEKKDKEADLDKKLLKKQNAAMFSMKDKLKQLSKKDLTLLLEYNNQEIPPGVERILDRLIDVMTFGALKRCDKCQGGQYVFRSGFGYKCTGSVNEWAQCQNINLKPQRVPFKLPPELKELEQFANYKCKVSDRVMQLNVPSATATSSSATAVDTVDAGPKVKLDRKLPLKDMDLFLYKVNSQKDKLKVAIEKMGGHVTSLLHKHVACVVSTQEELDNGGKKINDMEEFGIQVVDPSFIDKCKDLDDATDKIIECSISSWGSDPRKRIAETRAAKSAMKSKSSGKSTFTKSGGSSKLKLKVQSGSAVDPESGLDEVAHVYRDKNDIYSVTLGITDVQTKRNSFYKLQILEGNNKTSKKYWLFRSWGRIGTTIGGTKLEKHGSLNDALKEFCFLYEEKTGNMWENHTNFKKVPGKMYPLSIDYGDSELQEKQLKELDASESKLKKQVQELIMTIFDINLMKKTMVEYEIDLEKLPLGKISKSQIMSAYSVLTELQDFIKGSDGDIKPKHQPSIIAATNRFYTLVPHSFGIADPPLLDNVEIIKNKIEMLDSLLEIELAYSIMQSSQEGGEHSVDSHYKKLNAEIDVIERETDEFTVIQQYLTNTHAKTHSNYELEILEAFKVSRKEEERRYKPFKKLPNRKLLWHGSRLTNFAGILSQGLRIAPPEAPVTGYMFGKGIYFADMVSKSANYCMTSPTNNVGLLMLCEVALGEMYERTHADYIEKLPKGYHSCKGVGGTCPDPSASVKLDGGLEVPVGTPIEHNKKTGLLYNEYIVYDTAQVKVKYLLKLNFNYKY